jgi:hypothetical protein
VSQKVRKPPTRASARKQPVHKLRSRREVWTAVAGAAAVVILTGILLWLMRPGAPGTEGTGGLANRQPRATWLIVLTVFALAYWTYWVLKRQRRWREKVIVLLVGGWTFLATASIIAGFFWPGGLLRHPEPPLDISDFEDLTGTTLPTDTTPTSVGETIPTDTGPTTLDPNATTVAPDPNATTVAPPTTTAP